MGVSKENQHSDIGSERVSKCQCTNYLDAFGLAQYVACVHACVECLLQ